MKPFIRILFLTVFVICNHAVKGQTDSTITNKDSVNTALLLDYNKRLTEIEQQRIADSIKKEDLEIQLNHLKTTDNLQKEQLLQQLKAIEENEKLRVAGKKARIDSLRNTANGFPVISGREDTLFVIYSKIGASTPKERASNISRKIKMLLTNEGV